ncbi:MAG: class II fructose-bisphosphatase [Alphaproteobacteria bacterium]
MVQRFISDIVNVSEVAAIACYDWVGRGKKDLADQAAVDAMRTALNNLPMKGRIAIGEGERDEAPMLYIGEEVGSGTGIGIDIALDPLEGTDLTAQGRYDACTLIAFAERGNFLHAPDVYMEKIAVGGGLPEGVVDLDESIENNLKSLAKAKGRDISDLRVCILDRERHQDKIDAVHAAGAKVILIQDGDVRAVINTTKSIQEGGVDLYIGSGGAPEGVLAATALRCIGGQIQARLLFRNDVEKARAAKAGVTDLNRKYSTLDMAKGDVLFAMTGVTQGSLVNGVEKHADHWVTHTLVMDSATGSKRITRTEHPF